MTTQTKRHLIEGPQACWDIEHWPKWVYPHSVSRGRYLVRWRRKELIRAGVLTRVGRDIVILGDRYQNWLEKCKAKVPDFAAGTVVRERRV